jgi:putative membrane protein
VHWDLSPPATLPVAALLLGYGVPRLVLASRGVRWPRRRDAGYALAVCAVVAATVSPVAARDEWFPAHVLQHLLLGMVAPLGLALAAPVTLALRAATGRGRRWAARLLRSRLLRGLAWPPVAVVPVAGGVWLLYLTPLYAASLRHPALHAALHAHLLLTGALLSSALVRVDPVPGPARWATRIGCLFVVMATHAVLAKYLYAHADTFAGPRTGTPADWRAGAQLLWYGGDLVDVALAVAVLARWYAAGRARQARPVRVRGTAGTAALPP